MKTVYIGPTIDGVAVRNTVYEQLPKTLKAAIQKRPYLSNLCVSFSALKMALKQIDSKSGSVYKFYQKAQEESAEIMKGEFL